MPKFVGTARFNTGPGGDEGGEIVLAPASTNTTVSGNVVLDVYQNKLRIYESSGNNRGAYIDLTSASNGVGSNLLAGGGGATTLDGLTDVTAPSPSAGDYLAFNGSVWVNSAISIQDITEINAPSPSNGQFLKWNGTAWVNDAIDLATDTTGNYVSSLVAGTGITLTNNSGEAATPTVAIGQDVGTTSTVTFGSVTAGGVTAGVVGSTTISTDFGDLTIAPSSGITNISGLYANDLTVYGDTNLQSSVTVGGPLQVEAIREKIADGSIVSNNMTCDHFTAGVFYVTSPSANFTVNVTNLPTTNGFTATVSIFVQQGATGYIPNALQIAGTGQTIKWSGGTTPTPTSSSGKIDVFTFTLIRRSSAWTVLGSANLNY